MGKIELDHTGSGSGITLSSDGTSLLLDGTAIGSGGSNYTVATKTSSFTVATSDLGKIFYVDPASSNVTASLPAAATAGSGFYVTFTLYHNSGVYKTLTIDPDGSEKICDLSTYKIKPGMTLTTYSDGSNWFSLEDSNHMISTNSYGSKVQANANGNRSIAIGDGAYSNNNYSTALGKNAYANGVNSIAIGATNSTVTADAASATAIGANSGSGASQAHGNGAIALNGSYASGNNSFAGAIADNSSSYGATGANSIAIGELAKATATDSVAIGSGAEARYTGGVALGFNNESRSYGFTAGRESLAMGFVSTAIGYDVRAYEDESVALGRLTETRVQSSIAFGSYGFGSRGDCQSGLYVLNRFTTDATATALIVNGYTTSAAASSSNQIVLPNNSAYAFHGTIVARQKASEGTASAAWKVEGLIRREGSAGTTVLVNSATTVLDNTPSWGMALSADTTNGGLKIEATGAASTNIRWVATIHTSELQYA